MNERITPAHNNGFALWGLTCFYDTFEQGSTFVLRINICGKNRHPRQAPNRQTI